MSKKLNKKKICIVVSIIILIIIGIICFTQAKNKDANVDKKIDVIISENQFENINARDIEITYDENTKQTSVKFILENKTEEDINNQSISVILIDTEDLAIASIYSYVEFIQANGEFVLDAAVSGDVTNTAKICLVKPTT